MHIPLNTFQIVDVNGMKNEGNEDFENSHEGKCWFLLLVNTSQYTDKSLIFKIGNIYFFCTMQAKHIQ